MDPRIQGLLSGIVKKKQASDTLYYTIREGIATGLLPMGSRLREEELAEAFDVSRTPVREAMKKLELEQLIDSTSTNGSRFSSNCTFITITKSSCSSRFWSSTKTNGTNTKSINTKFWFSIWSKFWRIFFSYYVRSINEQWNGYG